MVYRGALLRLDSADIRITSDTLRLSPELDYGDNEEFIKLFILAYVKFLSDSPLESKPRRIVLSFVHLLCSKHVKSTIIAFSRIADHILENKYVTGRDFSTEDLPPGITKTPIFREYLSWVETGRPELLKYILSFLRFGKKLEYVDEEFNTEAFRQWCEVEERLRTLAFDVDDITSLANIIRVLLPPLKVDFLAPKFGPGKVAERGVLDVFDKLGSLSLHPRLAYAFLRERPGRTSEVGFGISHTKLKLSEESIDVALKKDVPKDITKSRSICMEPNTFMYFQQEVMRWMVQSIESGLISRFVTLDDQTNSQRAALHGSKYLSVDTIDLSSASDSVHVDLVRKIFPPDYLFYMMATRTSKVQAPNGEIRSVHKFAPMGSAVCFPTQCILFAAVCIYGYMQTSSGTNGPRVFSEGAVLDFVKHNIHREYTPNTPYTGRFERPVVYGDDIAVDTKSTDNVISTLTRLGFQVNRSKSFTGARSFRESCGVYAHEGQDVTPATGSAA
jgi:hypothetical protein